MTEDVPMAGPAGSAPVPPVRARRRRSTYNRPGAPTLSERQRRKVEMALDRFKNAMPDALAELIEMVLCKDTPPSVKVQVCTAIEKLTPYLPKVDGDDLAATGLTFSQYAALTERLRKDFPSESAWELEKHLLLEERDRAIQAYMPLVEARDKSEAENFRLRTAVHRLTGKDARMVIEEMNIPPDPLTMQRQRLEEVFVEAGIDVHLPAGSLDPDHSDFGPPVPLDGRPIDADHDGEEPCAESEGFTSSFDSDDAPAPPGPLERCRAALARGEKPGDDLLSLTWREIDKLERDFGRQLQWSSGDPDAPHNRNRRPDF